MFYHTRKFTGFYLIYYFYFELLHDFTEIRKSVSYVWIIVLEIDGRGVINSLMTKKFVKDEGMMNNSARI